MSPLGTPENPDENVDSKQSAAPRAAVVTGNSPLDPQLELLIERWPTLSKEIQQQIMLLVG
jgi:hypothetical protein